MVKQLQSQITGKSDPYSWLPDGGEMGRLTREFDWSKTPVGSVEQWPQSLRTTVSIILSSKFPMFLWWGKDLTQFYNDAYRPSLGNNGKHPYALGQRGQECWPEIWPIIYPLIEQVLTTGESTWSEDQLIPIYRNGQLEDVYWTFGYSPITGESNTVEGVLVVCNETTEKVINARKLAESNAELKRINNDLDNFIYTASHDLKAPVSNLEGLFYTLFSEITMTKELAELKEMIEASFKRFTITIKDLTEISKIQKESSIESTEIFFSDVLKDVEEGLTDELKSLEPEIISNFSIPSIKFSRKNLRSIIYNFISNGIKYSSPGRKPILSLSTEKQNEFIVLTITDNGLGVAAEHLGKMFQMFKRLHNHVEGTGIGLYIVKRIVDNAGGKIEVQSELGKGTTFKIYLKE